MQNNSNATGGPVIDVLIENETHQHKYRFVIIMIAVIAVMVTIITINGGWFYKHLPVSTIDDKTLPAGTVNETDYYTDELGWMRGQNYLISEMQDYYKRTGVQPYIYIAGTIDGTGHPTASQTIDYINSLYDQLFTDEGHILLFYFRSDDRYAERYVMGDQAKTVVDGRAANDLLYAVSRQINP